MEEKQKRSPRLGSRPKKTLRMAAQLSPDMQRWKERKWPEEQARWYEALLGDSADGQIARTWLAYSRAGLLHHVSCRRRQPPMLIDQGTEQRRASRTCCGLARIVVINAGGKTGHVARLCRRLNILIACELSAPVRSIATPTRRRPAYARQFQPDRNGDACAGARRRDATARMPCRPQAAAGHWRRAGGGQLAR